MIIGYIIFLSFWFNCISSKQEYAKYFDGKTVEVLSSKSNIEDLGKDYGNNKVIFPLFKQEGIKISLLRDMKSFDNDIFIINDRKYQFLKHFSGINKPLAYDADLGIFNLQTCSYYIVTTSKKRKYFILDGGVQGATGSMAGLRLFFVVDFTDKKNLKLYSLQNWAEFEFSFFDFDKDGFLDYSSFKDLQDPKHVEITNYSLYTGKKILRRNKVSWKAEWKEKCLLIE